MLDAALVGENDATAKSKLFRESDASSLTRVREPLDGEDTYKPGVSFAAEHGLVPAPIRVGFRSFDRQWLIPDSRVIDRPRPELWAARRFGQLFVIEQHSEPITDGPGLVFSSLIPDMHYFNNRGGRALPLLHPNGSLNVASGFLEALGSLLEANVSGDDFVAYLAAVVAHPGFTGTFADELATPGIRVPLTRDAALFSEGVELGRQSLWAQTYGDVAADKNAGRPAGNVRFTSGDPRRILNNKPVLEMPEAMSFDSESEVLRIGSGEWGPVGAAVVDYVVGGRLVVKSWFDYRKARPAGKRTSPLDDIHLTSWPSEWSVELTDLLTVLTRLVELEPAQANLLERVLAGPIATTADLIEHGARWPKSRQERSARYNLVLADGQLPLL